VTFALSDVQANGGWAVQIQPPTPVHIQPSPVPYGTIQLDPNDWTTIVGVPSYGDDQLAFVREIDSRHGYFDWSDDGYRPLAWQVGPSDPYQTDAWSPYGSVYRTANPPVSPGVY
jgi:hypothetical protein